MAGGGHIIIKRLSQIDEIDSEDREELSQLAVRSDAGCSLVDAIRVLAILWKYLRSA